MESVMCMHARFEGFAFPLQVNAVTGSLFTSEVMQQSATQETSQEVAKSDEEPAVGDQVCVMQH